MQENNLTRVGQLLSSRKMTQIDKWPARIIFLQENNEEDYAIIFLQKNDAIKYLQPDSFIFLQENKMTRVRQALKQTDDANRFVT